jgi:Domain of unknown function (DUF1707)
MAMRYYAPFPGQNGQSFRAVAPHVLRIGDAERDAAAADLGEHYVAGRLTLDELHERLGAVFCAKTYGQLARIMADLPRLRHQAAPGGHPRSASMANAAWAVAYSPPTGFPPSHGERQQATPSDRAGRFAALSLLILAMLIWLFTALLFARHGFYYHPVGNGFQMGHGFAPPAGGYNP